MAVARTGVFVDDYLEYSSTLPAELQRPLNTVRELDERSQSMINQTRQQTKYYRLGYAPQDDSVLKEIESNQDNALSLCTEKVLLARQAHDLIDSHIRRLDQDLISFAEDLKQEGKIAQDEPAVLPPLPLFPRIEKQKSVYGSGSGTPFLSRIEYRDREDRDYELMPPPGSVKKEYDVPIEVIEADPSEPRYCICKQVSYGDMIACDNDDCQGGEWFHYDCVGLTPETRFKEKWYCPTCKKLPH